MSIYVSTDTTNYWDGLQDSWVLALEAENKARTTIEVYLYGPIQCADWLRANDHTDDVRQLTPALIRQWLRHLGETQSEHTARSRYVGLKSFIRWCLAEGELDADPMANISQPAVHETPPPVLTPDNMRALLADCEGKDFVDLRDKALVLMFIDTGCRLSELTTLLEKHLDLRERTANVVGKGSRHRVVAFSPTTARALDRYLRAKRRQPYGDREWLWISSTGKGRLTRSGVYQMLRRRGRRLGIRLHPHQFRHAFADAWLAAGGGETDLMELTGWKSRQMVGRYAAANRAKRAIDAHRRLSPVDAL